MKKRKILITSVHLGIGGIESSLVEILNRIDEKKYSVDLYLLKNMGVNKDKIPSFVNVYSIHETSFLKNWKVLNKDNFFSKSIRKIFFRPKFIKYFVPRKKYDVAIAFAGYHNFMDEIGKFSNAKKKYIWVHTNSKWLIDHDAKYQNIYNDKKYQGFNKIVFVSDDCRKEFLKLYPELKERSTYIWNLPPKMKKSEEIAVLDGKFKIVAVGRLTYQKGYHRLVEVHKKLIERGNQVDTYLIGDGEEREYLSKLVNDFQISASFHMLGSKNNVPAYLKAADLMVGTSYSEGFPMVLIEALECGLPFVVPNVSGYHEIAEKNF